MTASNARNENVDFVKGLLIWGVIWGHTITALSAGKFDSPVWIHTFFRTYDLPLFMILSGYFFQQSCNKYSLKELLLNKTGMLLVPIVFWNLVNCSWSVFYFLWAVFISSLICIPIRRLRPVCQIPVMLAIVALFHYFKVPWNMFYLFPFFCIGFLSGRPFIVKGRCSILLIIAFVTGLCFWKSAYTPWQVGYDAWKSDAMALAVYAFRFILAVTGAYVMSQLFFRIKDVLTEKVKTFFIETGKKTLALYVLQTFVVEKALNKVMLLANPAFYDIVPDTVHALIGYVIAPLLSVAVIMLLRQIIGLLEKSKYTSWVFGTRLEFLRKV